MPSISQGFNLGDLLKYEAPNLYSREAAIVAAGQNLTLGTVVGMETATSKVKALDPAATDGSKVAIGILACDADATLIDVDSFLIARHAIVAEHAVVWPAGITAAQKTAAIAQLKSLGILIRSGA